MPRNITHTNLSCFGAGIRSYLSCTKNLNNSPALLCSVQVPESAGAEPKGSAVMGLGRADCQGQQSPRQANPVLPAQAAPLCHPALTQQLPRVKARQKEIPTMILSQYTPNQGNYSGAVEFLV